MNYKSENRDKLIKCAKKEFLTNGFIKKTQKTPTGEKERAKQYRKDYMEREGEQT